MKPSSTYALAAMGLVALVVAGGALLVALFVSMGREDMGTHVGQILTTLQVIVGALAAVSAGGAGAMGLRDFGSRGLTSSQVSAVLERDRRARGAAELDE